MRYTTTDGPSKALNAIQDGSLGDKMGIADVSPVAESRPGSRQAIDLLADRLLLAPTIFFPPPSHLEAFVTDRERQSRTG